MYSGLDEAFLREIAHHSHTSVDHVRRTYQLIIHDLQDKARIQDFIPLLAMKSLKQHFRELTPHPSLNYNVGELCQEREINDSTFFGEYVPVKRLI